jgi:hypothetical protein
MTSTQDIIRPTAELAAAISAILTEKVWEARARLGGDYMIGTVQDHFEWATVSDSSHLWAVNLAGERGEFEMVAALVAVRALVAADYDAWAAAL